MRYYPLMLDLRGRACVVAGGGAVAERKVLSLAGAGAAVTIVSPTLTNELREFVARGRVSWLERTVQKDDLRGALLVIAATDDREANERISGWCRELGILVNVATSPAASSFLVPSVVERGDLLIAVSTSGASPALARRVRERLEQEFGPEYGDLLAELALLRKRLGHEVPDRLVRKRIYAAVAGSDALALFRKGDRAAAERRIEEIVRRESGESRS